MWPWASTEESDAEDEDTETLFGLLSGYRGLRHIFRPKRKTLRIVSGGNRTEVPEKTQPPWLVALTVLLVIVLFALLLLPSR